MGKEPSDREILWRQYALYGDLYKFYIDIAIKYNVFHYGITGAILVFYFTHPEIDLAKWSLVLPFVLSAGAAGVLCYGASLLHIFRDEMFDIRDKLELDSAPDFQVPVVILRVFGGVQAVTAVGLIVLLFGSSPEFVGKLTMSW